MKRLLQIALVFAIVAVANPIKAQTFTYPIKGNQGFSLNEKTRDGLHVNYSLGQFSLNQLEYRGENMSEISISGVELPNAAGCPNLPVVSRMIAIPQGATPRLNVVSHDEEILNNVNIAPALRIQAESEEPDMTYEKDRSVYGVDAYYPEEPFVIGTSKLRGVDVVTVSITPFQYNPVRQTLRVFSNVELALTFEGGNGHFGDDALRSPYWDPILAGELMNFDQLPVIDYEARMQQWLRDNADGAEYLIITPNNDDWAEYANQLRDYRRRQGILTEVYRLDELPATTTAQMKSWFHNAYNNWTIKPVAVLLFGDHNTNMGLGIPAETTSHPSNGSCITDNGYADVDGDNLPDMAFSRLVAANATEAQMMASKQIEYEYANPNMDASSYDHPITALGWQTERWFQLCSEVVGGYWRNQGKHPIRINAIYQGTPGSIWSSNQNTSMVVNYFGPNGTGYIPATPAELGGWTGGTPAQVLEAVNNGSMLLQHRDHGLETGWGEPAVRNSHVAQTTNVGKLLFVMSINCLTGKFNYSSDCFCEAWMRRTYNGQNAGAVGLICPTETSYSFVNDAYVWGVYDQYDPNFLPDYGPYANYEGNWQPAFGNVAGKYFLQQSAWPYNSGSKDITHKMFTAHCDAFLRLYTQVPQTMDVTHSDVVVAGYGALTVAAPEGCMISLVKANIDGGWDILAVATATGDSQVIEFEPQLPPTVINIVVTGQNYLRYEDTIEVVPAEGAFVVVNSYTPHTTPVNQQTLLSMDFKNVGLDATAGTTTVSISSQDDRLTIVDGTGQFGALASNQVVSLEDEFSFIIAQTVPDNTRFNLNVTMTCGENTWTSVVTVTAAQALPEYVGITWAESFDPGETLTLTASFKNNGHYKATNAIASIASESQYISFANNTYSVGTLEANSQVDCTFSVTIASNCPESEQIPITFTLNADGGLVAEGSEILKNNIISVSASPELGGTVSGAGKYAPGATCTITAEANDGYVFVSWTLDGVVASYFSTYSFTVTESAEYVANFIAVSNGVVVGEGTTSSSYLPSYSYYYYTLSQQIYTADELGIGAGEISSVSFFNTGTTRTRSYTVYMLNTNKTSFVSGNDWIAVTESDLMFSGSITMTQGSWTTIYFSTPFNYDGTSNIALIVDDNTGSWESPYMSCRVSPTESNQSLYVYSDGTNYDPYNPSYSGTRPLSKNQIILGFPSYDYTVTVTANPTGGGVVSGGGDCYYGQPVTIVATASPGYVFSNWTKNGSVMSYLSSYTLTVTENAEYVANFQQVDGIVIGQATNANPYLPTYYYYSLTEQIYTAAEMGGESCDISSVSFFNTSSYSRTRNVTVYMVNTSKTSFESTTDWIAITESDQVFSGNVTIPSYGWATVYFDTPFHYNGTSNVALIMDDNTNSYNTSTSCRTFGTNGNQALRLYGSGTNYDPIIPTGYSGALVSEKNQVIFGLPSWDYTVTVLADPTVGGEVNGGGLYYYGQNCTVTAEANSGYSFYYWTENGTVVSTNASYTFAVTDDRNLVSHFGEPLMVTVSASPEAGGSVSGGGIYNYNESVMLTATTNPGYVFNKWTKNGSVVSYNPSCTVTVTESAEYVADFQQVDGILVGEATGTNSYLPSYSYYCYTLSQQIYTADEIGTDAGMISSLSFFNAGTTRTRSFTVYMVNTEKTSFESATDWISVEETDQVFSGSVTMTAGSWTTISFDTLFNYDGTSNIALIVDDNTGNWTSPYMSCRVYSTSSNQSLYIYSDGTNYDPYNPSSYSGTRPLVKNQIILGAVSIDQQQTTEFQAGWNWWSTYIECAEIEGLTMLEESLGNNGLMIMSQTQNVQNFYPNLGYNYWFGSLSSVGLENEQDYRINVSNACNIVLTGPVAFPGNHPITVQPNWNWIGYPVMVSQNITTALGNFQPMNNDMIKGQRSSVTYYDGYGWWPTSFVLEPGKGYMYYSNASDNRTLTFVNGGRNQSPEFVEAHFWSNDVHAYANNFSVIATALVSGVEQTDEDLEIGAFVDGECRGSASLNFFEPTGRWYAFLTIVGQNGDKVEFGIIDRKRGRSDMNCETSLAFVSDAIVGSLDNPCLLNFGTLGIKDHEGLVSLYPNPVVRNQTFSLLIPEEETVSEMVITNALGAIVRHDIGNLSASMVKGLPVSGVYTIKVICKSGVVYYSKLIVK